MKKICITRVLAVITTALFLLTGCGSMLNPSGYGDKNQQQNRQDGTQNRTTANSALENGQENTEEDGKDNTPGNDEVGKANPENGTASTEGSTEGSSTEEGGAAKDTQESVKAKALYLTGWTAGSPSRVEHFIELAKNTEINAYVVDIKDDDGFVGYESQIPEVREHNTWMKKYNAKNTLKVFHDNDIYVIGRLVAFKDPVYSAKRPELAVQNVNGGIWKDNKKKSWLDPYNKDAWEYLISIAKEAVELGFDEIQFDYVRFPSDGVKKNMDFSGIEQEKYQAICEFLAYAAAELPGTPVSADVFGIVLESPADTEGIGQYLEYIGKDIDYICPMVYPSHYAYGQIVNKVQFPAPDFDPYGVVYNTLVKAKERLSKETGYKAKMRPYLQGFTASYLRPKNGKKMYQQYGAKQAREQIEAVYDAGYEEWIFWDPSNKYSYYEEAFEKE